MTTCKFDDDWFFDDYTDFVDHVLAVRVHINSDGFELEKTTIY